VSQLDVNEAMAILEESRLLKIEDILPFFPDFVVIDDFKPEICKSLQEYSERIKVMILVTVVMIAGADDVCGGMRVD
jgi:hypothetical protein